MAEGQLTVLHKEARLEGSREVAAGLWVSEDFESVREALLKAGGEGGDGAASGGRVKCVAGYAGWHPAQLAAELRRNVWFLAEADADSAAGAASPRTSLAPLAAGSAASPRTSLASLALLPGRGEVDAGQGANVVPDPLHGAVELMHVLVLEPARLQLVVRVVEVHL